MLPTMPGIRLGRLGFGLVLTIAPMSILATVARAVVVPYRFTIGPTSGLSTTSASVTAHTSGTLIGNWDAIANPTGTRTKPGLFGTFADTENVAVNTSINFATSGAPSVPLGGAFRMGIDGAAMTVALSDYVNFNSGPSTGALATSATVTTQSFRTRNPTSTFPGGIPVTIPVGDATITSVRMTQTSLASGTLTLAGAGRFSFAVSPTVDVLLGVNLAGNDLALGPVSMLLPMQGTISFSGSSATLDALAPVQVNDTTNPAEVLPPIPFGLPTVLPPGDTANVLFNLTLDQLNTMIDGSIATQAAGRIDRLRYVSTSLAPEPAWAASALLATLLLAPRRPARTRKTH